MNMWKKLFGTQRANEMSRDKKLHYPSQLRGIGVTSQKQLHKMKLDNLKKVNKTRLVKASFLRSLGITKLARLAQSHKVKINKRELTRMKKKVYNQNYNRRR